MEQSDRHVRVQCGSEKWVDELCSQDDRLSSCFGVVVGVYHELKLANQRIGWCDHSGPGLIRRVGLCTAFQSVRCCNPCSVSVHRERKHRLAVWQRKNNLVRQQGWESLCCNCCCEAWNKKRNSCSCSHVGCCWSGPVAIISFHCYACIVARWNSLIGDGLQDPIYQNRSVCNKVNVGTVTEI
jgi:hypothetical protein